MNLKVATYNVLLSTHIEQLTNNIVKMAEEGVSVFCLQEVLREDDKPFIIDTLLKQLGKEWKAIYHLGEGRSLVDFGTGILWNGRTLKLVDSEKVFLPKIKRFRIHEWLFGKLSGGKAIPLQRRAITGHFKHKDNNLLITSIHLDNVGGENHRQKQIRYFLQEKSKKFTSSTYQIVCGDFNTFDLLKTGHEKKGLQQLFGKDFIDASKDIPWTDDICRIETPKKFPLFIGLIKLLGIHIKRRLDYVWTRNFTVEECRSLPYEGSDHLPIIAQLRYNSSREMS